MVSGASHGKWRSISRASQEQITAGGTVGEAVDGRWSVVRRVAGVETKWAGAQFCCDQSLRLEGFRALRARRGIVVAAPIEHDCVVMRVRQLFQQVNAAIHQAQHRVVRAGPPVAICLGRLVAGEREGLPFIHNRDVGEAAAHSQEIAGGDPCDACAADHDWQIAA